MTALLERRAMLSLGLVHENIALKNSPSQPQRVWAVLASPAPDGTSLI